MTTPLPARPQGIRTSPDGLSVAALYDTTTHGLRWFTFTIRDDGTIQKLDLLTPGDVEGWQDWCHAASTAGARVIELDLRRARTVQDVVDGLPPGTEVT